MAEGTWSDAEGEDFCTSPFSAGSGIQATEDGVVLATPTHPLEKLYVVQTDNCLIASNSLISLFSCLDDEPHPRITNYHEIMSAIHAGTDLAMPRIPTRRGYNVQQYACTNLHISRDLSIQPQAKPPLPPIATYEDYRRLMRTLVSSVIAKANSDGASYEPITTLSTGYDSVAVSAIVVEIGCKLGLTLTTGRPAFGVHNDDGSDVGAALGLSVTSCQREAYKLNQDLVETLFLASGTGGEDVIFASFHSELPGHILFTGIGGDIIWRVDHPNPSASCRFNRGSPVASGNSIQEYRLARNFLHVPLPLMCFPLHPQLHLVSNSPSMAIWNTGPRGYKRPIPRRIAADLNVPMHLFGQRKAAATQPFYFNQPVTDNLSDAAKDSFLAFSATQEARYFNSSQLLKRQIVRLFRSPIALWMESLANKITGRAMEIRSVLPTSWVAADTGYIYAFHWAHRIQKRHFSDVEERFFHGKDG